MKICSKCKTEKQLSDYHKRNNRPCGVRSICKACYKGYKYKRREGYEREYDLMKSYSITVQDYNEMYEYQNGKCKICEKATDTMKRKKHLCVDHNHDTGQIRGLLCDKCNRAIGLLGDSISTLKKAVSYLEEHNPS